ncbi:lysM domain receptor-like kinase 3 [Senna tora]|uniref:LysM domain receptor-like kinase 3 n=1 Tax=Senna tora TaxID=362788 RepID=A0A834X6W4_9FABA|nr:lysM domain receptor-like kinase 3 [Senna tora]
MNSSGIIVIEPSLNAKICHFGAAQLCGEIDKGEEEIVDADRSSLKCIFLDIGLSFIGRPWTAAA